MAKLIPWKEGRKHLCSVNPQLTQIIDALPTDQQYQLIHMKHQFGDSIVTDGVFQLDDPDLKTHLNYSTIPLFTPLDKNLEVFVAKRDRVVPLNLIEPGRLVGLFETVDALFNQGTFQKWSVNAGVRSIFMLPKITDQSRYRKMDGRYQFSALSKVKTLGDHWALFKHLAQHENFPDRWTSDILVFTQPWFNRYKNNTPAWYLFYDYIFKEAWQIVQFALSKFTIELEWETFAHATSERNLKVSQYIANTIKHLIAIGFRHYPGFTVADTSERSAPIKALQQVFIEDYHLSSYFPVIMHIATLHAIEQQPVYYSLSYPTLLEGSPLSSTSKTVIADLQEMITSISTMIHKTACDNIIHQLDFNYFHMASNSCGRVHSSNTLPRHDNTMVVKQPRAFPALSQFFKGCISVALANSPDQKKD